MVLRDVSVRDDLITAVPPSEFTKVAKSNFKKMFDRSVAAAALLLFAPLMLLIALLIVLEDGGPVLFRQNRTGICGRTFVILKFRSMRVAEDGLEVRQAIVGDARTTNIGRIIRALSFDEFPQLINVLTGEMSLIGPRPHAIAHDNAWGAVVPNYRSRFRARPGLTGYAQVSGLRGLVSKPEDIASRIAADNYYIENWSVLLDLKILLRTVPLVFRDAHAF